MSDEKKLLEAQQAVLGSMLIDEKTVGPVLQDVTPDDFTTGAYRQIFLAFRAQFATILALVLILERLTEGRWPGRGRKGRT